MTSPPLDSTHGRTTSGVACHHRIWAAHTVERRQACHAIIASGKHPQSNDVRSGMTSPPLDSTYGRTTSGVKCLHRLWTAHSVKRHRAWLSIIAFGQHTRSNYVWRGKTSPPLNSTHGRTTSGVPCHHRLWAAHTIERRQAWHAIIAFGKHKRLKDVARGMPSWPLDTTHGRTKSVVACHHSP